MQALRPYCKANIHIVVANSAAVEMFRKPGAALFQRRKLVADAPAAVAALDHVHEAFFVALVAVVVAGEQIAVFGERE